MCLWFCSKLSWFRGFCEGFGALEVDGFETERLGVSCFSVPWKGLLGSGWSI